MSEIVVYGIPGSPFVRSVQLCLEEKSTVVPDGCAQIQAPYAVANTQSVIRSDVCR